MSSARPRLPKYVKGYIDRHGKPRHYFAPKGAKQVPLPGTPYSTEFMDAYGEAVKSWRQVSSVARPGIPGLARVAPGSMEALILAYYNSAAFSSLKPITQATYKGVLEGMRRSFGSLPVSTLKARNIEAIMSSRADRPEAANSILKMFRILMPLAIRLDLRTDNPTNGIKKLKSRSGGYKVWEEADVEAFYRRHPAGSKARLAFDLMIYTGMRRADIVRLGRQHIKNGVISNIQSKTGGAVDIPVHQDLQTSLDTVPSGQLTFLVTEQGLPFTAAGFGNWFRDRVAEAGLRDGLGKGEMGLSAHGLRKLILTRLAEAGCSAHQIIAISGHKSISEVMRYTQAADRKRLAAAAIAVLRPAGGTQTGTDGE